MSIPEPPPSPTMQPPPANSELLTSLLSIGKILLQVAERKARECGAPPPEDA